jgi:hypothetical protein
MIALIANRLREISQRVRRLIARIQAGRPAPRRNSAPASLASPPTGRRPRRPDPLPRTFGWLHKLVPEVPAYRSQLGFLLNEEEMAALLAAAPASMRRPIRSLCHMLGLEPPPILALPPSTRPKPPKPERPPAPARPRRSRPGRVRYVFGLREPPPFANPG